MLDAGGFLLKAAFPKVLRYFFLEKVALVIWKERKKWNVWENNNQRRTHKLFFQLTLFYTQRG